MIDPAKPDAAMLNELHHAAGHDLGGSSTSVGSPEKTANQA